jgi:hypothetical protein
MAAKTAKKVARKVARKAAKKAATRPPTRPTKEAAARRSAAGRAAAHKAKTVKKKRIAKSSDNNQLHLLFKTDKQCRDCFEFLHVQTLEELQRLGPREIVDFLSVPFMRAVERMRSRLAEIGTCLAGDESFLLRYQQQRT